MSTIWSSWRGSDSVVVADDDNVLVVAVVVSFKVNVLLQPGPELWSSSSVAGLFLLCRSFVASPVGGDLCASRTEGAPQCPVLVPTLERLAFI